MFTELKHTLRRTRGQIIGWGIGLALYSLLMVSMYGDIAKVDWSMMLEYYPEELMAFFGDSIKAISSPVGYIDIYFFNYMTVIVGIFAVGTGAKLLVQDEEQGIMDLIAAYPISRSSLFWGRVFGYILALILILGIAWLCWIIPASGEGFDITAEELTRPFLSLISQLLLFGFLSLMLSMLLPSTRMASMITAGLLVGNYLLVGLGNINQELKKIVEYTPLNYYQGGKAIEGLNQEWVLWILAGAVLFLLTAWWRFEKRDLRVGGEGSWQLNKVIPFRANKKQA